MLCILQYLNYYYYYLFGFFFYIVLLFFLSIFSSLSFLLAVRFLHFSIGFLSFLNIEINIYIYCSCCCRHISSFFCFDEEEKKKKKEKNWKKKQFWCCCFLCRFGLFFFSAIEMSAWMCECVCSLESVIFLSYFASNKIPMWTKKERENTCMPCTRSKKTQKISQKLCSIIDNSVQCTLALQVSGNGCTSST